MRTASAVSGPVEIPSVTVPPFLDLCAMPQSQLVQLQLEVMAAKAVAEGAASDARRRGAQLRQFSDRRWLVAMEAKVAELKGGLHALNMALAHQKAVRRGGHIATGGPVRDSFERRFLTEAKRMLDAQTFKAIRDAADACHPTEAESR